MTTDYDGNEIEIGDKVTHIGNATEFVVTEITKSIWGTNLITIAGPFTETGVKPENVIKI